MSAAEILGQPAFILQLKPYRETSLLMTVFTRECGVVGILARGVRKPKSRLSGILLPFTLLRLSYLDRHELKVLTQAEYVESYALQRMALYCGFYVNELIQRLLHAHDPHPDIFDLYRGCLQHLSSSAAIESVLRYFELDLLERIGYGIDLSSEADSGRLIEADGRYRWQADYGLLADATGLLAGSTLLALAQRQNLSGDALHEAKQLLRKLLEPYLGGRPLKSRQVLSSILSHL
jgi:DNA repair protein RecO (recombination protein O)